MRPLEEEELACAWLLLLLPEADFAERCSDGVEGEGWGTFFREEERDDLEEVIGSRRFPSDSGSPCPLDTLDLLPL
jgi:hypothetical protein